MTPEDLTFVVILEPTEAIAIAQQNRGKSHAAVRTVFLPRLQRLSVASETSSARAASAFDNATTVASFSTGAVAFGRLRACVRICG